MRKLAVSVLAGLFCGLTSQAPAIADSLASDTSLNPPLLQVTLIPSADDGDSDSSKGAAAEEDDGVDIVCLPSPIATVKGESNTSSPKKSKATMVAQNSDKIACQHDSPAPPSGVGKKINVKAYAYCLKGRTASGKRTGIGTVAVDSSVIPLGSKIYIPGYGWGTALDTGGHMRGNVIDIWYPSNGQCTNWGVRNVTITVLPR